MYFKLNSNDIPMFSNKKQKGFQRISVKRLSYIIDIPEMLQDTVDNYPNSINRYIEELKEK